MDAMECIITRQSVRRYTGEPISDEMMLKLLQAGANAPSAGNQQPWHFITITDKEVLKKIADDFPYGKMLPSAACAITVCMNIKAEPYPQFAVQDCAAATQNILLAAHAMGLGAVWIGTHPIKEREGFLRGLLGIPHDIIPLSVISVGHTDTAGSSKIRLKPEMVHKERW